MASAHTPCCCTMTPNNCHISRQSTTSLSWGFSAASSLFRILLIWRSMYSRTEWVGVCPIRSGPELLLEHHQMDFDTNRPKRKYLWKSEHYRWVERCRDQSPAIWCHQSERRTPINPDELSPSCHQGRTTRTHVERDASVELNDRVSIISMRVGFYRRANQFNYLADLNRYSEYPMFCRHGSRPYSLAHSCWKRKA